MAKARKKTEYPSFIDALNLLEEEKGINKQIVLDALKEALIKSYKKNYLGPESKVDCTIDENTGQIRLYEIMDVVEDLEDEDYELSLEEAQAIKPDAKVGDQIITEVSPEKFGRLAATQTKQLLRQKIREVEKESLYNEFAEKQYEVVTGTVDRVESNFAIININRTGAFLPNKNQIPGERIFEGQRIKVYISEVKNTKKGTHIGVSRTDPGLVKRLFEAEVPEIVDGIVEIREVAREPGERSKIAVYTSQPNIDPIGSCVGVKGQRVRNVVSELNGEMIDIILWNEDPVVFISNALSPASVTKVLINEEDESALVIVPDNQLSLAIGKRGQNARLAVRLTKWKIDIKSESEAKEAHIDYEFDEPESFEDEFDFEDEAVVTPVSPAYEEVSEEVIPADEEVYEEVFTAEDEEPEVFEEVEEVKEAAPVKEEPQIEEEPVKEENKITQFEITGSDEERPYIQFNNSDYKDYDYDHDDDFDDYDDDESDEYDDDYDPKYDEDIDYDAYDEYYD